MRKIPVILAAMLTLSPLACLTGCGGEESTAESMTAELETVTEATSAAATETTIPQTTTSAAETTELTADSVTASQTQTSAVQVMTQTAAQTVQQQTQQQQTQQQTQAPASQPASSADIPVISTTGGVTRIENNIIVANSGTDHPRAVEQFCGNYNSDERYAKLVSSYAAAVGPNVHTWLMVPPTSQAFYQPDDVALINGSQQTHFEKMTEFLSGVTPVPVIDAIAPHKNEPIYSRTDYHWQPLGAYYAAEQFASLAGVPFPQLSTYQKVTAEGYLGAFYNVNKISELAKYPEPFTYYKPANNDSLVCTYYDTRFQNGQKSRLFFEGGAITYCVFVGRDNCILEVDTDTQNDRVLVIFKDSFGNALVPFLTQSFSKIYLCDIRYFDINAISFIKNAGATDLLFAVCTTNAMATHNLNYIEQNMKK